VIHEDSSYVIEHIPKRIWRYGSNRMKKMNLTHIVATNSVKVLMRQLLIVMMMMMMINIH
jgi:hypothetical protein